MTVERALDVRAPLWRGLALCLLLVVGLGGWATQVTITGAVIAVGEVDATPLRHPVEHPEGGPIVEIAVREGQSVDAGAVLIRLDSRAIDTELALIEARMAEAEAREARLVAERDTTPYPSPDTSPDPVLAQAHADQVILYQARRTALARDVAQLRQRRRQAEAERDGLWRQAESARVEEALVRHELDRIERLLAQGLAPETRRADLAREAARLDSLLVGIAARSAEIDQRLGEIDLQIEALEARYRQEAAEGRAQVALERLELAARAALLRDRRDGLVLRAPAAGIVHGLATFGTEGVLRPAVEAMQILAPQPRPVLLVRVRPDDIDHVHVGQSARLRLPALAARDLPDFDGRVTAISPAPFFDDRTGQRYYRVEILFSDQSLAQVALRPLVPGMAVEAFIATGERTPLAYLVAPLATHLRRALREG